MKDLVSRLCINVGTHRVIYDNGGVRHGRSRGLLKHGDVFTVVDVILLEGHAYLVIVTIDAVGMVYLLTDDMIEVLA